MTGDSWEAHTLRPGPDCVHFADWLSLLTPAPSLTPDEPDEPDMTALRAHVDACIWCQHQVAIYTANDRAVRVEYAIPTGRAPFLTLDAIVQRVAAQDVSGMADMADATDEPSLAPSGSTPTPPAATLHWTNTARHQGALHEIEGSMTPYNEQKREAPSDEPTPSGAMSSFASPTSFGPPVAPTALATASQGGSRNRRFIQALAGLVAAAVIVGLFGALFYTFGANHRRPNRTAHTTKTTQYLGANGHWVVVSKFTDTGYQGITVAPSNPQVIYTTTSSAALRRSDDGGQTWTTVSVPTQDFPSPAAVSYPQITVSPLNPQVVIVTLGSDPSNPNCPASKLGPGTLTPPGSATQARTLSEDIPLSGGYSCTFQYVSGNGGASWTKLALADQVKLSTFGGYFQAGGTHLYDFAQPNLNGQAPQTGRLMGSADGGVTWAPADALLAANGQGILQYAATTTGSTIFAVTIPNTSMNGDGGAYTPMLWRSDDAGAHWTNEGDFNQPAPDKNGVTGQYTLLTATSVGGQTLLYELKPGYAPRPGSTPIPYPEEPFTPNYIAPGDIFFSADSGHTWSEASQQGVPAGLYAGSYANLGVVGTLDDGQITLFFYKSIVHVTHLPNSNGYTSTVTIKDAAYYAWSPSEQSWQQLTPSFDGHLVARQWITPATASQPETIWQIVRSGTNFATTTVERCALT